MTDQITSQMPVDPMNQAPVASVSQGGNSFQVQQIPMQPSQQSVQIPPVEMSSSGAQLQPQMVQNTLPPQQSPQVVPVEQPKEGSFEKIVGGWVSKIANMSGNPDPVTGQPSPSQPGVSQVSPSQAQPTESKGFFSSLFGGFSSATKKIVDTGTQVVGETVHVGTNLVGTAVNAGTAVTQGVTSAVANNQGGNVFQNTMGAVTDAAKSTLNAGTTMMGDVVQTGVGAVSTVSQNVPIPGVSGVVDTFGNVVNSTVQMGTSTLDGLADKGTQVVSNASAVVSDVGGNVVDMGTQFTERVVDKTVDVVQSGQEAVSSFVSTPDVAIPVVPQAPQMVSLDSLEAGQPSSSEEQKVV